MLVSLETCQHQTLHTVHVDGASVYVECSKSVTYEFPWSLEMVTQTGSSLYFGAVLGWMMRDLQWNSLFPHLLSTGAIEKHPSDRQGMTTEIRHQQRFMNAFMNAQVKETSKGIQGRNRDYSASLTSRSRRMQGDDKLPILTLNPSLSTFRIKTMMRETLQLHKALWTGFDSKHSQQTHASFTLTIAYSVDEAHS